MKLTVTYRKQFKRRTLGKTNYKKRLQLLLSKIPRLVVRRSLKYIRVQIIEFDKKGDRTLASANSRELKKIGWNFSCDSLPAAYLTGLAIGKVAVKNKIPEVILDSGLYTMTRGSRIYAVVKGVVDAGLKIPVDPEVLPSGERIAGKHMAARNGKFKDLPEAFQKVKERIMSG